MNINYEIRETEQYGKGLYTLDNIPAGTRIWTYTLNENVFEYDEAQSIAYLEGLPNHEAQQRFLDASFGKGPVLCLIRDDGQYVNHAAAPACNCQTDLVSGHCYSLRAIEAGEQIFEDYSGFSHPPFLFPLLKQYDCEPDYYVLPFE
jgi:hypothetical protein